MSRFMLVVLGTEEDGTPDEPFTYSECKSLIPCQDEAQVGIAIGMFRAQFTKELADGLVDWNLFELVEGHYKRRAVSFKPDGRTVLNIS